MPWTSAFAASVSDLGGWLWLAGAILPSLVLAGCVVWLWRMLTRARSETRRSLAHSRHEQAARTELTDELRALRVTGTEQASELELARRFQILAENASDVVMETDRDGVIRWITPSVRMQIGRDPTDVIGAPFARLVHPDERDRVRALEHQVSQGAAAEARLRLRIADDGYQWFAVTLRPVFDDRQEVVGRVGGWSDIHREVQAQEIFAAERRRLRTTLEGMLDPIAIIEPVRDDERRVVDFTYLDVNPAACAWFGADRDQLVGERMIGSFPQVESAGLLTKLAEVADTGRPLVLDDFPLVLRGTDLRRLDVRGIRGDDWISLVWRDVSERHRSLEKLAASEEQFRLLAENSTDVIIRVDFNDTILWVSPSITSVLGWAVPDCIGRDGKQFLATAEALQQYERNKSRAAAGQGATSRVQIRAVTGDAHWLEVHSFPYRTSEGVVSGMVASLRVVDTEVRLEQDLERRARIDAQTGLLNRMEMVQRLTALIERNAGSPAVLWCDIDHFKGVNDTHGHAAGDAVLEALGTRLRGCLRSPDDMAARIGGDELMLVLHDVPSLEEATRFAEEIRRLAEAPIEFQGVTIVATLSVGVTLALPGEGIDALLARADDAMYQAKERGRNQVVAIEAPAAMAAAP